MSENLDYFADLYEDYESLSGQYYVFKKFHKKNNSELVNILMIDDSEKEINLFKELVNFECNIPVTVTAFNKPSAGLEYLKEKSANGMGMPDLIILDINMPEMNGKEALLMFKQNIKELHEIPIIIYSSESTDNNILEIAKQEANGFFTKPMNINGLSEFVNNREKY